MFLFQILKFVINLLAGLPNASSKEELDKLISMLNDEKVKSCVLTSPDEFYETAAAGDVLKVLYMLGNSFVL